VWRKEKCLISNIIISATLYVEGERRWRGQ